MPRSLPPTISSSSPPRQASPDTHRITRYGRASSSSSLGVSITMIGPGAPPQRAVTAAFLRAQRRTDGSVALAFLGLA